MTAAAETGERHWAVSGSGSYTSKLIRHRRKCTRDKSHGVRVSGRWGGGVLTKSRVMLLLFPPAHFSRKSSCILSDVMRVDQGGHRSRTGHEA
jgi:hypothetical protein